jgi:hypothetical protein
MSKRDWLRDCQLVSQDSALSFGAAFYTFVELAVRGAKLHPRNACIVEPVVARSL